MTGERTILRGTTVVDVRDGRLLRAVDITVEGGRIATITPTSDDQPERVAVVDATGTFAVPGFCDMHAPTTSSDCGRTRRRPTAVRTSSATT